MSCHISIVCVVAVTLLFADPARAERMGKGRSLVLVTIGGHTGQFISVIPPLPAAGFPGLVLREESGEIGGEIAFNRFISDETTLGISGSYYAGTMKTENGGFAVTSNTHSFSVRVGGDRFAFIDDHVAIYAGPGLFFRRGRWTSETEDVTTIEGPD